MSEMTATPPARIPLSQRIDVPLVTSFICIIVLLIIGSMIQPGFLSPAYLLQQFKVGAFLGIVATGAMLVILLGQIDLSVPWTLTLGAMMAAAASTYGVVGEVAAIPFGILCGAGLGLINGVAVAYLRIPSMIITLAINVVAQGLMVAYSGGFSPRDSATPAMRWLGSGNIGIVPVAVIVWAVVGVLAVLLLKFTVFGRSIYGIGNKEAAAYLSGIPTQRVVMLTFVLAGALSAFAGVMLAGYSGKAAQSMGDPYLLSAIAAVVLGGTSILGGRGKYVGTIAGVIFITLLQSILGTLQFGEYFRQVAYGVVIVAMLLLYGRDKVMR